MTTDITRTATVSTVRAKSWASAWSRWRSPLKIGTNGAVSAPATRTSSAISGILKAAL